MESKIPTTDIAVFSFIKDSQFNSIDNCKEEYIYVSQILSRLIEEHNSEASKIGIGGYLEDVSAYISFIVASYNSNRKFLNIEKSSYLHSNMLNKSPGNLRSDQGKNRLHNFMLIKFIDNFRSCQEEINFITIRQSNSQTICDLIRKNF